MKNKITPTLTNKRFNRLGFNIVADVKSLINKIKEYE